MSDSHPMWKRNHEFAKVPCDRCVKDSTYINKTKGTKKCAQCGHEADL